MTMRFACAPFALAVLLLSSEASADVYISAQCSAATGCVFTNTGDDTGSGCAVLALGRADRRQLRSGMVCSGSLAPNTTGPAVPVQFEADPIAFCADDTCEPRVEMTNVRQDGLAIDPSIVGALVVLASALGVYFDAKRIGARRGLVRAPFDLSPAGWALAVVAVWIAAFPAYLLRRGDIARAAERAKQPPST